jgi:lipoate---protein ligase
MGQWNLSVHRGPAADYLTTRTVTGRSVVVVDVDRPTLVLGSTQPDEAVDALATVRAGVAVIHRRSGGSAVLVEPGEALWVDVAIPAGDPLWEDDVGRAFHWLGRAWVAALAAIGVAADWHSGPMVKSAWSAQVCFAGLGPGEVTAGGRKAIGMSQRRTRAGALFQCSAALTWEPARLLELLNLSPEDRRRGEADLADVAVGVGQGRGEELAGALVEALGAY